MSNLEWLAVDWGTTHLRVWGMDQAGQPIFEASSDRGMSSLNEGEFEPALTELVKDYLPDTDGKMDVFACGMVGSRQGLVQAGYLTVPCKPLDGDLTVAECKRFRVHIVPGLKQDKPADVMRGEEVQIAGYLAKDKDFDGVLVLPGTHSKWARISAEEVVSFQSVMTGELFSLLSENSVLRHSLVEEGFSEELFIDAVSEGMAHPARLSSRLFSLRAEGLLSGLSSADARSRLSGLLVGMELAATKPYWLGQNIKVIGAESLTKLYAKALEEQGCLPDVEDATQMTLNGLVAVRASFMGGA